MSDRRDKERLFRQSEGTPRAAPYVGILPSGETVQGTKAAIQEMHAAIWRAEPTTTCTGQTYRDFAERCDRARQEAEQRAVDAIAALEAAAGSAGTGAAPPEECYNCKRIPDGPFSSANPRMTICRDCWVAAQPPTSAPCGDFHNHLCERCGEMWPAGSGVPREETK